MPHPDPARSASATYLGNACALVVLPLTVLTLGECRLFNRLLFQDREEYEFVLQSISGVLSGRPVSQSWQHRFFSPWLVTALGAVTSDPLASLKLFSWLMLGCANILLFVFLRRRFHNSLSPLLGVACFGLAHLLLAYRLEYAWDGVDILLFMSFGHCASRRKTLFACWPLLVIGTLNHETALFIPLWYLLSPLEDERPLAQQAPSWLAALGVVAAMAGTIWLLRHYCYVGQPNMPAQFFERPLPIVANHWHVQHNLRQFLRVNWRSDRAFISLSLLITLGVLGRLLARGSQPRAALWSLCVLASIVAFGYVNETRHYLMLLAFWFAYAWTLDVRLPQSPALEGP